MDVLAFITLSSLLLFTGSADARKNPEEYWKDVMKEQPMPEAIQGLLPSKHGFEKSLEPQNKEKSTFGFNLQSTAIIYHKQKENDTAPKKVLEHKAPEKVFALNSSDSSINVRKEENKSSPKDSKHSDDGKKN